MSRSARRVNIEREAGPTRAKTRAEEYRTDVERRFRKLRGVIRTTVVENNALNLDWRQNTRTHDEDDIAPREGFPFSQRAAKQLAFRQQLKEWIDDGILEPVGDTALRDGQHWTGTHVRAGYDRGLDWANRQMAEAGRDVPGLDLSEAFNRGVHEDAIEQLYTRNFRELEDITTDMDRNISRVLARSFGEGVNPRKAADRMTKEVRDIQRTRARMTARTEFMNTHSTASKVRYRENGVTRVRILGTNPCPICQPYVGNEYQLNNIPLGGPPFHPNCVGAISPVI